MHKQALWTVELALSLFGTVLLLSLPAIWMAWTPAILLYIVGAGALAAVLVCLFAFAEEGLLGRPARSATPPRAEVMTGDFVARVQQLAPFTYHHRRLGDRVWGGKAERLREYLRNRR